MTPQEVAARPLDLEDPLRVGAELAARAVEHYVLGQWRESQAASMAAMAILQAKEMEE